MQGVLCFKYGFTNLTIIIFLNVVLYSYESQILIIQSFAWILHVLIVLFLQ